MLLACELLLRLLPVSSATMAGYYFERDILSYPARHAWTVATGWDLRNTQRMRSNNVGFAAERDFIADRNAIGLVGDSYVEAASLEAAYRPAEQLMRALGNRRPVYALGSPGTGLLDYGHRMRWAHERFKVRDFVLWLDPADAHESICGSGYVHAHCLDPTTLQPRIERTAAPSLLKRLGRHSALAQYFLSQLKLDPARLRTLLWPSPPKAPGGEGVAAADRARAVARVDAVVDRFFEQTADLDLGRVLFIVDGYRRPAPAQMALIDFERARLLQRLASHGANVFDLEPVYAAQRSPLSLEIGPYDAHHNVVGVQLVTALMAKGLRP